MRKLLFILSLFILYTISSFAADYYWVGGSGNWSDINHWRTSSGGSVLPNVVPGPTDDVYFDANSGFTSSSKTIAVNVAANCRNITFDGASVPPTLGGTSTVALNIYGSSVWQAGMSITLTTMYYQDSGTPKTIKTNGVKYGNNVYLQETTSITLLDDAEFSTYCYLNAGTFNTNNFQVKFVNFYATSGTTARTLNLGSSDIYVSSSYFNTSIAACTVNAGTSTIHFTGQLASTGYGLLGYSGQIFNNVIFENELSTTGAVVNDITINRLEYKGGGYLNGNTKINELILSPGKLYQVVYSKVITINSLLQGGEACEGWLTLRSSLDDRPATISMPTGATVSITGAVIKDIVATGGATYVANSSVDDGGNSGWSFIQGATTNLYWVGGAGDWGDAAHWSLTSGGAGGACVPGPDSNVFFDANSGFTDASKIVNLDGVSYCRDITFSGSAVPPTLNTAQSLNSLNIYGSSVWQAGMTLSAYTINYQDTGTPKTITSNGVTTLRDVNIRETTSVSLLDDYDGYAIYLYAGTFNTNSFDMTLSYQFVCNGDKPVSINLGSSDIYMTGVTPYFRTQYSTVTLDAGTSHIHFTGAITSSNYGLNAYQGQTYYNVSFENPAIVNAGISAASTLLNIPPIYFNKVDLKGGVSFVGYMNVNELIMAPAKTYSLYSARTFTVNKSLTIGAACEGWTILKASTSGNKAILSMPSTATVNVQGVIMTDISATGGANFVANGSLDQSNNSGWSFVTGLVQALYWVNGAGDWNDSYHWSLTSGGAGGDCVPGPDNDVFFDANSGFTSTSKIVTVAGSAFCRDITVSGAATPPTIQSANNNANILNIYGSSVWQSGMASVAVYVINYQNTGTPKTITSNGVTTGVAPGQLGTVNLYETTSISITDDLKIGSQLYHYAGTFSTNDFRVDIGRHFYSNSGSIARVLDLGASHIYLSYTNAIFNTSSSSVTVNAGTSHIHFTGSASGSFGIRTYAGQTFYNVSFENVNASIYEVYSTASGSATTNFNRVEFKGGGRLMGNNTFNELLFLSNKTYQLQASRTQTVNTNLTMSGTPCNVLPIQSATSGTLALLNVVSGTTNFNFVNIKDINASGLTLHFGAQSTVANQNNVNITYDPYDAGAMEGLGSNWTCHTIDDAAPETYIISASGFYGNEYTQYAWRKSGSTAVVGTESSLDISTLGYGTYTLTVTYNDGCTVSDEIVVEEITPRVIVTSSSAGTFKVCVGEDGIALISSVTNLIGQNIRWYETEETTTQLPENTPLIDGGTYYLTQTIDECESLRTELVIEFINCKNNVIYINPGLRFRVPK